MKNKFDDLLVENDLKQEIQKEMFRSKHQSKTKIKKNFQDLTSAELFSCKALWKVFNRKNYTNSLINGIQAESFLADQDALKIDICDHKTDCFLVDHLYVEFYKFS